MKLSFVIPAHNEERWIGKCLDSIVTALEEIPCASEIIVVNNASTDRTTAVAKRYPGVIVIDEPRKGTNQARHTGFLNATGELIANIDADCLISKKWLAHAFREFSRSQKLVALSGPYVLIDVPRWVHAASMVYYAGASPIYLLNNLGLRRGAFVIGGNVVIRKSALTRVNGYNTALQFHGDDTDTAARLEKVGRVKFNPRFTVYSSGRRLLEEGVFTTAFRYAMNYAWVTLFNRPFTRRASHPVRTTPQ